MQLSRQARLVEQYGSHPSVHGLWCCTAACDDLGEINDVSCCVHLWDRFKCVASELKIVSLSAGASAAQECDRAHAGIVLLFLVTWVLSVSFQD